MKHPYYAVVYVYDEDGSEKVSMPCFTYEQVMQRAARYEKVRVVMEGKPPFWLKLSPEERGKYPLPTVDDTPLEWMRDYGDELASCKGEAVEHTGPQSDIFHDVWKSVKKDRHW